MVWLISLVSDISGVNQELCKPAQLLMTVLEAELCLISLAYQFIIWVHSQTVIQVLNMLGVLEKDNWFQMRIIPCTKKRMLERLSRSLLDLTGAFIFTFTVIGMTAFVISFCLILLHQLDPVSLLIIDFRVARYNTSLPVVIIRFVIIHIVGRK